jgi:hypothetical protein
MSLPGFSAEASLSATGRRYGRAGSPAWRDGAIHPAQGAEPVDITDIGSLDVSFPRVYGIVAGSSMEDRFVACMTACRRPGRATYADCQRTCCRQLTGYSACYIA